MLCFSLNNRYHSCIFSLDANVPEFKLHVCLEQWSTAHSIKTVEVRILFHLKSLMLRHTSLHLRVMLISHNMICVPKYTYDHQLSQQDTESAYCTG
jgi:hypothetical protein